MIEPEEPEVDDYLNQGIAAFSIDRHKQEHCHPVLMRFKNPLFEKKVRLGLFSGFFLLV